MDYSDTHIPAKGVTMLKTIFKILFSLPILMIPLTIFIFWISGMTFLLGWHS